MDKKSLEKALRDYTKSGVVTRQGIAGFLGIKDAHAVDKYINSLGGIGGKYYLIEDVADELVRYIK